MNKSDYRKIPFRKKYTLPERIMIVLLTLIALACSVLCAFQIVNLKREEAGPHKAVRHAAAGVKAVLQEAGTVGTVLTETADAGREYTDETLFLGDSNTVRFFQNYDTDGQTFTTMENTIAVIGMGADAISTLPCMQFSTGTFTMVDSVSILQPRRIIMTFGTNHLDGFTTDAGEFIGIYEAQIRAVQDAYPYADIIIQSIFPIAEFNDYPNLTISQIRLFNSAITDMCRRCEWKYLNTYEALSDSLTGFARPGMMDTDGLHLSEQGIREVFRYIRTHAYESEDRRPMPLEEIPEIYGPLTNLLHTNPLTNEPFAPEIFSEEPAAGPLPEEQAPAEVPQEEAPQPETPAEEIPAEVPPAEEIPAETPPAEEIPDEQPPEGE